MPDKGKDIERAKQKALNELKKHIDEMGVAAYGIMLKAIEDTFDFKAGKIVGENFIEQLNKLTVDVLDLLQSTPKFTGPIAKFIKRMPEISDAISTYQKAVNGIKVPSFNAEKKIVIDEVFDKMLDNGLNQHFVQPLRDLIYQNVTSGLSIDDARIAIKEYIQGGKDTSGKLGSYIEQTAGQAVRTYSGIVNMKILETFDMNALRVMNPLIDNSSPQCRYAKTELNSIITRENWHEVAEIGEKQNGWIKGTNFDNVSINLLHWGCLHEFSPFNIIKKSA